MATLGKLKTKAMSMHANMTDLNNLGMNLMAKPAKLMGTMDKLFSASNYYSDNPLSSQLMGTSWGEETISNTAWDWELKGANTRPLVVVEDMTPASNVTVGKYKREFPIKLDENWYLPGDILSPGTSDKKYQVRVVREGKRDSDGKWIYQVVLMTTNRDLFLPKKYLSTGQQWAKLYSQYEEGTIQAGSTQFSLPIALTNKLGKYRKTYKITDYASTERLAVRIQDSKGNYHDSWIRYAEVEYWNQWYRELERGFWYSRSTDDVLGENGRPINSGPGIQEQLEDSHVHRYTHLTAKLIEEYLMDIFYGRVKPGAGRKIKGFTGEYGMLMFHRAIQAWAEKSGFIKNIEVFTSSENSSYHSNALSAGYQFMRYKMANGAELELIHNPLYDDREINFEIDPISGFPVESQRITFLDFTGESSASGNVKIMKKAKSDTFVYVNGSHGPMGPNTGSAAHGGDYYEMVVGKACGIHIHDVTKCGELILSRG